MTEQAIVLSDMYFRQKVTLAVEGYDSPLDYLVTENYLSKPVFHQMSSPGTPLSERDYARVEDSEDYSQEVIQLLSDDEMRNLLILDRVKKLIKKGTIASLSLQTTFVIQTYLMPIWL